MSQPDKSQTDAKLAYRAAGTTARNATQVPEKRAYLAVLDGVLSDADEEMLVRRLDHHLQQGYTRFFVDTEEVVSGIGDLRARLCRWGVEHHEQLEHVHVLVPSMAAHARMAITGLFVGSWLRAYTDRIEFLAAITGTSPIRRAANPVRKIIHRFDTPAQPRTNRTLPYISPAWRTHSPLI